MDKDKNKYIQYILFDEDIPYVSARFMETNEFLQKELNSYKNDDVLSEEEKQNIDFYKDLLKKSKLLFHPIKMENCLLFYTCIECLLLEKNNVPDINIIKMPYLDYLYYLDQQNTDKYYIVKLKELLRLSLNIEDEKIIFATGKDNHVKIYIDNFEYDNDDFENFKEIICIQNNIELPDENINPDLKKALEEAQAFISKRNSHPATIDDQIDVVMEGTGIIDRQVIKNMTIRTFQRYYRRYSYKITYQICKTAETGGMVKFKQPIDDWTDSFDRTFEEKYAHIMVDAEEFKSKVNMNVM